MKLKTGTPLKDLLKTANFRHILIGQFISDFGDSMTRLGLLLLINQLTGSITAMASMSIVLAVPRLLFGFVAGVVVDRWSRRTIMIVSDLTRGLFVLGFLFVHSVEDMWILYLIGFLQGTVATFFEPARGSLLPNLVPREHLLSANSVSQTGQTIFFVLGNLTAGVLVSQLGNYNLIFIIDSVTFFASAFFIFLISLPPAPRKTDEKINLSGFVHQVKEGIQVIFTNRSLLGSNIGIALTMLGIGAVNVLMVPMMVNILNVSESWFGATGTGQTIGQIIAGALISSIGTRIQPQKLLVIGLIGFGIGTALLSITPGIWYLIFIISLSSLFIPAITSSAMTIIQSVPDEIRGRSNAARSMIIQTANLISMGTAGLMAEVIGVRFFFVVGGAFTIIAGMTAWLIFRSEKKLPETV